MELIVEQGQEIHKDGRVTVYVTKAEGNANLQIDIAGTAVYVKNLKFQYKKPGIHPDFHYLFNTSIYEASPVVLKAERKLLFSNVLATCCNCCASS